MILQDTIEIIANQGNLRILRPIFGYDIEIGKSYFTPIEKTIQFWNRDHY